MSIEKDGDGYFIAICDECGEEYESPAKDFKEAVECVKDQGWKIVQDYAVAPSQGKWYHLCAVCR